MRPWIVRMTYENSLYRKGGQVKMFQPPVKTGIWLGRCYRKSCPCRVRVLLPKGYTGWTTQAECATHRQELRWNEIEGIVNDTKCDGRCTGAKGHVCECSCGGLNHGVNQ